jgi:hypothetical protein
MSAELPQTGTPSADKAEELSKLLEIELIQKRTQWQRATTRNKNFKTLSILFLFIVVVAGLAAFYFLFMQANEQRQQRAPTPTSQR